MYNETRCPACGYKIYQDEIDIDAGIDAGFDWMIVYHICPHCREELKAYFYLRYGCDFSHFEIAG